ncbi:MAG: DJ-1/PfpI family protein [Deltaproteobacteria bacterium]|nr:DJ-1/PfpI family protein [Deltaproteobacteria bacterium]
MRGFTRVIIIDALKISDEVARQPGEIVRYEAKDFKGGHRYGSAHSIGLGTVLELGDRLGYDMPADVTVFAIEAVDVERFDAVVIPGGYAPDRMRRHAAMVALVRKAAQSNKVVAAICHAGWMLASAEVLQGRQVTGFCAIKDDLIHAGATYRDAEVVVDGNIITSRQPGDLPAFCRAIIAALTG